MRSVPRESGAKFMKRSPPHSFLSLKEEKSLPVPSRFIFQIQLSVEKGLLGLCACACECQCVCFCRCVSSCPAPPESPPRILFFAGVERILKKKRMILSFPDVFCYCFPPPRTCSETSSFRRFIFEITFYCFFFMRLLFGGKEVYLSISGFFLPHNMRCQVPKCFSRFFLLNVKWVYNRENGRSLGFSGKWSCALGTRVTR